MMIRLKNLLAMLMANIFSWLRAWVHTSHTVRPASMFQGGAGKA
jgi:hypothetical protein